VAEHRFSTPEPVELDIRIPAGDIHVETSDGDESIVTIDGNEKQVEQTHVALVGGKLVVEFKGRKPFGLTIEIGEFSFGNSRLDVHVTVPRNSSAVIQSASADAKLRGDYASLETKSAAGDLEVIGKIQGNATLKTVSGDIRLGHVGGELQANSVSGDVFVAFVGGSAQMKSVSGDVRFESVREGVVTVQSISGDIDVGVAPGTNLDVDAGSVSGNLSSEVPLASDLSGSTIGEGPTLVVRGKTVSGDFRVFRAS
jgi:DUF4097 and DUF4098 domain-containing protein YvlB